jgi:hypothetical protein
MIEKETLDLPVVKAIEESYPQMTSEYKKIVNEQYIIFCKKQTNYGPTNISVGTNLETDDDVKLSLTGLFFRLNDKIQRIKQLIVLNKKNEVDDESTEDTFQDLGNYSIIAQLVSRKKWGR